MNGSFSIWDELKFSESSIWFAWGSCPEHIFHLGACVSLQRNSMAHLEMIARFPGSVMMFPNLGKRRTRQLKFLFCWPRWWQRARCFWGVCTAKASATVNQNISPIFIVFLKLGWSIFLNPFTSKLAPKKKQIKFILPNYFQIFSIRFQPRWNDTATAQWCIQPPQRSQKQDAFMWGQGFSCSLYFFGVSEIFGLFTLILGEDPIYFLRWMAQSPSRRSWLAIFCSPSRVGVFPCLLCWDNRSFSLMALVLWLLWRLGETRFNSRVGWGEGVSLFRGSSTWLFSMGFLGFLLVCL